jgi:hypothetical protein
MQPSEITESHRLFIWRLPKRLPNFP